MSQPLSKSRLAAERQAIAERHPGIVAASEGQTVPIFEGNVDVDGISCLVRLILRPPYPSVPPVVGELGELNGPMIIPPGSSNRFSDGSICLFPHGNDSQTWHREQLAVEALDRFVELKRDELLRATGPRRALFRAPWRLVVPPGIAASMLLPGSLGSLRLRAPESRRGDFFVDILKFDTHEIPPVETLAKSPWIAALTGEQWIPWVNQAFGGRSWGEIARTADHLEEELQAALPAPHYERVRASAAIVLARQGGSADANTDIALFARQPDRVGALFTPEVVLASPEDLFFQRIDGVVNDRDALADAMVVMIGLGSLGSAVALGLARSGIRRFILIDPDELRLDNVCRHIGTLRDLGRPKVEIVRDAIVAINPLAKIEAIAKWFAWDLPWLGAGPELEFKLETTPNALLVSTCAIARAEQEINELSVRRRIPAVYGAALGAAEHARIFRVLPGESPCYQCIVDAQDRQPARHPRFAIDGVLAEPRAPYVDPSLPGLGVDLTLIAMLIARAALQTLARVVGTEARLGPEDDHILWTNRGGWIFDRPLQVNAERFARSATCPVCGVSPDVDDDVLPST